jgi:hypothetical protein
MATDSEAPDHGSASGVAQQSRNLAETVIRSFVQRLTREATRRGGWLSTADIDEISGDLIARADALQSTFEQSFEDYVRARERAALNQQRDFPFDRQVVACFHHLFPQPGGPTLEQGAISRRMLPGFFMTMGLMLGPEVIEQFQERARAIVRDLRREHGDGFPWETVYADPRMKDVAFDALVAMAGHFNDPDRRLAWLLRMINDHLGPPQIEREGVASRSWRLDNRQLCRVLDALFADVRSALNSEIGKLRLTKAYGGESVAQLWDVIHTLDRHIGPITETEDA